MRLIELFIGAVLRRRKREGERYYRGLFTATAHSLTNFVPTGKFLS
jgi:hypothetical protein